MTGTFSLVRNLFSDDRVRNRRLALAAGVALGVLGYLVIPAQAAFADACGSGSQSCATITPAPGSGNTYADQTVVKIAVPANTDFTPGQTIVIIECADPGGTVANLPIDDTSCDGLTVNGDTLYVREDGDFTENSYTLFQLPSTTLKEPSDSQPVCNATNACVLFIGQDYTQFTLPHVFSQPFYMTGGTSSTTTSTTTSTSTTLPTTSTSTTTTTIAGSPPPKYPPPKYPPPKYPPPRLSETPWAFIIPAVGVVMLAIGWLSLGRRARRLRAAR